MNLRPSIEVSIHINVMAGLILQDSRVSTSRRLVCYVTRQLLTVSSSPAPLPLSFLPHSRSVSFKRLGERNREIV